MPVGVDTPDVIRPEDVEAIAVGAGILGTGGGGNVYVAKLWIKRLLEEKREIMVIPLDEIADDAWVASCGGIGAPTVSFEKLRRGDEELRAMRALEGRLGVRMDAVVSVEIGGANAMRPMAVAAHAGIPVLDADGMGRAFPELQMETFAIHGVPAVPAAMADDKGAVEIYDTPMDARELERVARARCIEMGGTAGMAHAMRGRDVKRAAIPGTVSLALELGGAVLEARERKADPIAAALAVTGGITLMRGKIVDVERRTTAGFARGTVRIAGTGDDEGREVAIDFQNEHLIARETAPGQGAGTGRRRASVEGRVLASVPDLVCIVATDDAEPVGTELLRYGYRVAVLALPAHPLLRTPEALAVVGPRAFGYDIDYVPLERDRG